MLKSVEVRNFRGFRQLEIPRLERVNLIAGKNSTGKTAFLEALFLLAAAENADVVNRLGPMRGVQPTQGPPEVFRELLWSPLFYGFSEAPAVIAGQEMNRSMSVELQLAVPAAAVMPLQEETSSDAGTGKQLVGGKQLQLTVSRNGTIESFALSFGATGITITPAPKGPGIKSVFLGRRRATSDEDVQRFGRLEMLKQPFDLIGGLRIIEPRLKLLKTISMGRYASIYGDVGLDRLLPLQLLGDGLGLLVSILLAIADSAGGIVLIDEVENGLHYSVLEKVWQAIGEAAERFDTQVFATTHSDDCIHAAHVVFEGRARYDFLLHRFDRASGESDVQVVTYDREALATSLKANLEVR